MAAKAHRKPASELGHTTTEAARIFDKLPSTIRRLCIKNDWGWLYEGEFGPVRYIGKRDMGRLAKWFEENGRVREKGGDRR